MVEIITSRGVHELEPERAPDADSLWISAPRLAELTGWELKPEGFCQDEVCVPVAPDARARLVDGEQVNAVGLWKLLQRPVLGDESHSLWVLGDGAQERAQRLGHWKRRTSHCRIWMARNIGCRAIAARRSS